MATAFGRDVVFARVGGPPDISSLFDEGWYRARNRSVVRANDPFQHFIDVGAWENRNPCPLFDLEWYREQNGVGGLDALDNYLLNAKAGLDPHPLFDTGYYLSRNSGVSESGVNPLAHYRLADPATVRDPHPLFDHAWYLANNTDVARAKVNPLEHYITFGAYEGRDPNPFFDSNWYLTQYADVAKLRVNPLAHYCQHGVGEGRDPSNDFDTDWYLSRNTDVVRGGFNPLAHYLHIGRGEGRLPIQDQRRDAAVVAAQRCLQSFISAEPAVAEMIRSRPVSAMERVSGLAFGRRFTAWQLLFDTLRRPYDLIVFVSGRPSGGDHGMSAGAIDELRRQSRGQATLIIVTDGVFALEIAGADIRVLSDLDIRLSASDRAGIAAVLVYFLQPQTALNIGSDAAWRAFDESGAALSLVTRLEASDVVWPATDDGPLKIRMERALPHLAAMRPRERDDGR